MPDVGWWCADEGRHGVRFRESRHIEFDNAVRSRVKFIGQRTADGGSFLRVEGQLHEIPQ